MKLITASGFWGTKQDWNFLAAFGFEESSLVDCSVCDPQNFWNSSWTWEDWARARETEFKSPWIGVGYSLGARVLLQQARRSESCRGLVLVSCHPGLESNEERAERLRHDHTWADQILTQPSDLLLKNWNQQSVFQFDPPLILDSNKVEQAREQWAWVMKTFSLAHQPDQTRFLSQATFPISGSLGSAIKSFHNWLCVFKGKFKIHI